MAPPPPPAAAGGGSHENRPASPASHPLAPPTTWTAAEIAAAQWPTPGGEPVWRAAPVAEDYALAPAGVAAALAARAAAAPVAAGGAAGGAAPASAPMFHGYPHYAPEDRYVPRIQADGGVLSDWKPMYAPTKEQAEADRDAAFAAGVPFGSAPPAPQGGAAAAATTAAASSSSSACPAPQRLLRLRVVSELHTDNEYGPHARPDGSRYGGEAVVELAAEMRVEAARLAVRDATGVPPALLRLSYAGTRLEDSQRTLGHYGVALWHAKFPHWPLADPRAGLCLIDETCRRLHQVSQGLCSGGDEAEDEAEAPPAAAAAAAAAAIGGAVAALAAALAAHRGALTEAASADAGVASSLLEAWRCASSVAIEFERTGRERRSAAEAAAPLLPLPLPLPLPPPPAPAAPPSSSAAVVVAEVLAHSPVLLPDQAAVATHAAVLGAHHVREALGTAAAALARRLRAFSPARAPSPSPSSPPPSAAPALAAAAAALAAASEAIEEAGLVE